MNVRVENLEEWLTKRKTEAETHEREEKIQFEVKLLETPLSPEVIHKVKILKIFHIK